MSKNCAIFQSFMLGEPSLIIRDRQLKRGCVPRYIQQTEVWYFPSSYDQLITSMPYWIVYEGACSDSSPNGNEIRLRSASACVFFVSG